MTRQQDLLIGTYTEGAESHGEGIYRCAVDAETGALGRPQLLVALRNPSYLAAHPTRADVIYALEEVDAQEVPMLLRLQLGPEGAAVVQRLPLSGSGPCHLAVSADGRYLASAQYGSGDVDLFGLRETGEIAAHLSNFRGVGHGANAARQGGPHAHCVCFLASSPTLAVVDLGRDSVTLFDLDRATPELCLNHAQEVALPAGSGPRHLIEIGAAAQLAVLCELSNSLVLLTQDQGVWKMGSDTPVFADMGGNGAAGAIRAGAGGMLYASGRDADDIACIPGAEEGAPQVIQRIASGGKHPRDLILAPDGRHVFVANQHSNCIAVFCVAPDGSLDQTAHSIEVGSPACLIWTCPP